MKDVKGFEGLYKIDTNGCVINLKRNCILRPHLSGVKRRNYHQVTLYKDGLKKTMRVHSIMAITYLNHIYDGSRKFVVDHKDNNPLNNKLENLQIVSMQENNTKDR